MPSVKPVLVSKSVPKGARFVTLSDGRRVLLTPSAKVRPVKQLLIQGRGSRFTVRFNRYLTPELQRIKARQTRAERKAGVRVGNGLFDDPLSSNPKVIGVVKVQRKRQQHPASGKKVRLRKGSKGKKSKSRSQGISATHLLLSRSSGRRR